MLNLLNVFSCLKRLPLLSYSFVCCIFMSVIFCAPLNKCAVYQFKATFIADSIKLNIYIYLYIIYIYVLFIY